MKNVSITWHGIHPSPSLVLCLNLLDVVLFALVANKFYVSLTVLNLQAMFLFPKSIKD